MYATTIEKIIKKILKYLQKFESYITENIEIPNKLNEVEFSRVGSVDLKDYNIKMSIYGIKCKINRIFTRNTSFILGNEKAIYPEIRVDYIKLNNEKANIPLSYLLKNQQTKIIHFTIDKITSDEFQKNFLSKKINKITELPINFEYLEPFGYSDYVKREYDWYFNADDMGLMFTKEN